MTVLLLAPLGRILTPSFRQLQIVIIYDCFVVFLSFIAAFITLVLFKGNAALLHSGKAIGVQPVNAGFIVGYLSFINLYAPLSRTFPRSHLELPDC